MKKLAITYYKDIMRGVSHVDVHESGAAAVRHFKKHAADFFNMPIKWKTRAAAITQDKGLSVTIGMRGYHCRFLTEEEADIYRTHGDATLIDSHGELSAPEKIPTP